MNKTPRIAPEEEKQLVPLQETDEGGEEDDADEPEVEAPPPPTPRGPVRIVGDKVCRFA